MAKVDKYKAIINLIRSTRNSPKHQDIGYMNDHNTTSIWQITVGDFERIVENAVSDKVEEAIQLAFEEELQLSQL